MSKVLVTGGAGYIGSHTVVELQNAGYEVIAVDNLSKSSAKSLKLVEDITGKLVKFYEVDICDKDKLEEVFRSNPGVSGIIHFAAFKSVPESVAKPELYYHNNLASLVNIMEAARKYYVPNFVFSSSCSVYGDIAQLPVSEATPITKPKSPYAATKLMGERIVEDISKSAQYNALCLRYFNPVGAHHSGRLGEMPLGRPDNLVPVITQSAIGKREPMTVFGGSLPTRDGSCVRDYVHVEDIARAHLLALKYLEQHQNVFDIINLGTGAGVTVFEAISTFEKVSGLKLDYRVGPPRDGDVVEIYSDTTKAREVLGWTAQYGIEEMMKSAWEWEQFLADRMKG